MRTDYLELDETGVTGVVKSQPPFVSHYAATTSGVTGVTGVVLASPPRV